MTDCMYEEEPKIIGRINRKKSNPAENNKILLLSGSSIVEFKAASIKRPNNKTADTSVIPVKIDKKPERESILKLPDKDHNRKPNVFGGGGPLAGSTWNNQIKVFIEIA